MIIHCPLNQTTVGLLDNFVEAGAEEFYLGYRNAGISSEDYFNRRFGRLTNFDSLESVLSVCRKAEKLGAKSYVAINELYYPESWHDALIEDVMKLSAGGVFGFIISDINLIIKLKKADSGLFIVLSSTAHVMNAKAAAFYRGLGADRIVFPRQLAPNEIIRIANSSTDRRFELIVANEECPYLEGVCSYCHFPGEESPNICRQAALYNHFPAGFGYSLDSCGACALFSLRQIEGLVLKIAGRGLAGDLILKDIRFFKRAVGFIGVSETDHSGSCPST
jgi:collagenase-like PrtC family protease